MQKDARPGIIPPNLLAVRQQHYTLTTVLPIYAAAFQFPSKDVAKHQ